MSDLRDVNGRCLVCGTAEPLTCDQERHALVKQRGWINHQSYEMSHLAGEPCPGLKCRPEPAQPPREAPLNGPPQDIQDRFRDLIIGLQSGHVGLGRWRRGDKGPVEWLLSARIRVPAGEALVVLGRLFTGPMEAGWVPIDDDGKPMGLPTGTPVPQELALGGAKAPPDAAN